ncbi:tyrosine-protein phosphatase [Roseibacterium sp. SDUM158017]|uniref:tyrosine-protein phosphatase n=1 Tax=Roseicyclus salinarum TaxID=3036773 RepID=UPI002414F28B|nr:tyrosine-protein phosphatase [Roseibacterium sp. SDUM158017]MDG4647136.1 tyrosine-protein phosphatase [Roseibacterium sp. SDUM158017]
MSARRLLLEYWLRDHAWVRLFVPNFYKVDADLYRANHPGHRRLRIARDLGVKSVLSLRGDRGTVPTLVERQACDALGLDLQSVRMWTTKLVEGEVLLDLVDKLRHMPKPMLVHCKSGADRTGLAVTLYLHVIKGVPLAEARRALSWKYAHLSWTKAGIVHRVLDAYEADHVATGIGFEDWVRTRYDREALSR